jgi:hypothetical protein
MNSPTIWAAVMSNGGIERLITGRWVYSLQNLASPVLYIYQAWNLQERHHLTSDGHRRQCGRRRQQSYLETPNLGHRVARSRLKIAIRVGYVNLVIAEIFVNTRLWN